MKKLEKSDKKTIAKEILNYINLQIMNKHEITNLIEHFAPLEFAEKWDCSGWLVKTGKQDIEKV